MSSIFSKIVNGELPAFKVAENEFHLAFLDIQPIAYGHVLVIPKKETDYIFDIKSDEYLEFFRFAKQVAKGMEKAIKCKRISLVVIGLEVPHAHIHLVPTNNILDVSFDKPKFKFSDEKMKQIAQSIRYFI